MIPVKIGLSGCDDSTEITMEVGEDEFLLLDQVAEKLNEASTYGCQPTMWVARLNVPHD